jgi:hypothetical protein
MSLRFYKPNLAIPTEYDDLLNRAYSYISPYIDALHEKAFIHESIGRKDLALVNYKAAQYYWFLTDYAIYIRNFIDRKDLEDVPCNADFINEEFGFDCLIESLACIGQELGTDYQSPYLKILEDFGIDIDENCKLCDDVCVGVGKMIIDGEDTSTANIVGECITD